MKLKILFLIALTFCPHAFAKFEHKDKVPYLFPPTQNGVDLSFTDLSYALTNDGKSLQIGPINIDEDDLLASVFATGTDQYLFLLKWPKQALERGQLIRLDRQGKATWTRAIDDRAIYTWNKSKEKLKVPESLKQAFDKAGYGFVMTKKELTENFALNEAFVFCFLDPSSKGQHRMCSPPYALTPNPLQLRRVRARPDTSVKIDGKSSPDKAIIAVENDELHFRAQFRNGALYEFRSGPQKLNLIDVVHVPENRQIVLKGHGVIPIGKKDNETEEYGIHPLMDESVYPKFPEIWTLRFPDEASFIYVPGRAGGYFRHPIYLEKLPTEEERLYASKQRVKRTYSSSTRVKIFNPNNLEFQLQGGQALDPEDEGDGTDSWQLGELKKNQISHYKAQISKNKKSFEADIPVYRAFAYEASTMIGGAAQTESLGLLGDARFNAWFESLLGCENYYLCYQRWGLRGRYSFSQSLLSADGSDSDLEITSLQTDLYYRLMPGVWGVDEVVGLILGMQNLSFNDLQSNRLGVGFIWGRPLPAPLEPFFELIPFMGYPKWVHLDFTYYPMSMSEGVLMDQNPNWTLNFQGRVQWTERIYGETGFGIQNIDFIDETAEKHATSTALFGTMGLGIRF